MLERHAFMGKAVRYTAKKNEENSGVSEITAKLFFEIPKVI